MILIATLGSGVILARALGPAGRGVLTAAMLYGPLLVSVGSLGIAEALVYRSSREDTARSPALVTALVIGAGQSLVLVLVGWAIVPALLGASHPAVSPALVYLAYIPLALAVNYPLAVLQGRLRLVQFNLVRASAPILYTATLFVLWRLGAMSVEGALTASLASFGVLCIFAMALAARVSKSRPNVTAARELLGYGLRSHAGNLATILTAQLDFLLLTILVPAHEVGYYAVATSAAMTGSVIPGAASMVLFPTFANRSTKVLPSTLARLLLWGTVGALVLIAVLLLVLPWAVVFVYGPAFRPAAPITLILVPGYLLRGATQILVGILRGSGMPLRASIGQVLGLGVLAGLLPIGIATRGASGAAMAVTISAGLTLAWLLATAMTHRQFSSREAIQLGRSDLARLAEPSRPLVEGASADFTRTLIAPYLVSGSWRRRNHAAIEDSVSK